MKERSRESLEVRSPLQLQPIRRGVSCAVVVAAGVPGGGERARVDCGLRPGGVPAELAGWQLVGGADDVVRQEMHVDAGQDAGVGGGRGSGLRPVEDVEHGLDARRQRRRLELRHRELAAPDCAVERAELLLVQPDAVGHPDQ